jgi:hypothetical protein
MVTALTYHVRTRHLSVLASGKSFHLPTYHDPSRIAAWEKGQELRSGKYTLWDHCFDLPVRGGQVIQDSVLAGQVIHRLTVQSSDKLEVYDYPGYYAQRFDGEDKVKSEGVLHTHLGTAAYVGGPRSGIYIHGWPPCNLKRCVIVMRQWEDVWRAIAEEPELSFAIEY